MSACGRGENLQFATVERYPLTHPHDAVTANRGGAGPGTVVANLDLQSVADPLYGDNRRSGACVFPHVCQRLLNDAVHRELDARGEGPVVNTKLDRMPGGPRLGRKLVEVAEPWLWRECQRALLVAEDSE